MKTLSVEEGPGGVKGDREKCPHQASFNQLKIHWLTDLAEFADRRACGHPAAAQCCRVPVAVWPTNKRRIACLVGAALPGLILSGSARADTFTYDSIASQRQDLALWHSAGSFCFAWPVCS